MIGADCEPLASATPPVIEGQYGMAGGEGMARHAPHIVGLGITPQAVEQEDEQIARPAHMPGSELIAIRETDPLLPERNGIQLGSPTGPEMTQNRLGVPPTRPKRW